MLQFQFMLLALIPSAVCGFFGKPKWVWPVATLGMAVAVAIGFAAETAYPALLDHVARDPAILHGEIWRVVTALFFQDGGLAGFIFNLAILVLIGVIAEMRFGAAKWLAIYLAGGVITQFVALAWQPHGAGNSIACFALAGALITHGMSKAPLQALVRLAGFAGATALMLMHDIHGVAYWIGAALGVASTLALGKSRPRVQDITG